MKKGTSHIDWAISMGIFIVYILLLIMFIRPGEESVHDETQLLGILNENLKKDIMYEIDRTALFIDSGGIAIPSGGNVKLTLEIPTEYKEENLAMMDETGEFVQFKASLGSTDNIYFITNSDFTSKTFFLLFSEEINYQSYPEAKWLGSIDENDYKYRYVEGDENPCDPPPVEGCIETDLVRGVAEPIKGISIEKLDELETELSGG